jgi:Protein of unknown function (DUF4232)
MSSPIGLKMPRRAARALTLGACVLLLGLAAAPAHAAVPACKTNQLVVWLDTQSNGAAGTIFYTLNFTNVGAKCTLRGYPGISAVGRNRQQLGKAAVRDNGTKVKTVTLSSANGGGPAKANTAHSTLAIVDTGVLSPGACHPTTASGLRVFPPNQSAAAFVPYPFPACSLASASILRVRAVTK